MIDRIDGSTKLYAVIGDPISHSLSPVFQNYFINLKNINALYMPLKISPDSLENSLALLKDNFAGFNVTIPHKENIIKYLDEVDPLALEYGAVNTVKVLDGRLIGYNTDGIGFTKSIENLNVSLQGKDVLLLGAGGAAKVIAAEIIRLGGNLTIANRNVNRASIVKKDLESIYSSFIEVVDLKQITKSFDIIINSTSVGMHPNIDEMPIQTSILQGAELVYDLIYNPFETRLLKTGREFGAKVINGLPMLIYQGLKSFEIWTGEKASPAEEEDIYELLKNRMI